MGTGTCPTCNKDISMNADVCPHCGEKQFLVVRKQACPACGGTGRKPVDELGHDDPNGICYSRCNDCSGSGEVGVKKDARDARLG